MISIFFANATKTNWQKLAEDMFSGHKKVSFIVFYRFSLIINEIQISL